MTQTLIEFLRQVPMLAGLPEEDLKTLVGECDLLELSPGTVLFNEGDGGDAAYVVHTGQIEILKKSGNREVLLNELKSGDVFGEMALLDDSPRMAGARARENTTVVTIRKSEVQNLLEKSRPAQNAMFSMVVERLKSTEARLRQSERMVQLGTLTAGIAHELNNPAAAAMRSADQLDNAIEAFGNAYNDFARSNPDSKTVARARELIAEARSRALTTPEIDAFERSDAEAEIGDWLEDNGVKDGWSVSCDLVTAGYDRTDLDEWAENYAQETIVQLAKLVASMISVSTLLDTVGQATGRVSNIVNALKSYSFLDQAPIQRVDVTEGIDNSLSLLSSKLKNGIEIKRIYDEDVPVIDAFGSELNQLWTNIISNAIDAIGNSGEICVVVRLSSEAGVEVEISDNGPGIPTEIQDRVFDAFFTTKEPGKGTGLGLHTAYDIVVNKHGGGLTFKSVPQRTVFTVRLPPVPRTDN